ncbi:MAG: lipid-A-disaccharide synthase N-terminal domain-containing protein [Phycisphaeraceae bacterium]
MGGPSVSPAGGWDTRPTWKTSRHPLLLFTLLALLALAACVPEAAAPPEPVSTAINLQDRLADLDLHEDAGELYVVVEHQGQTQRLTAGEYLAALDQRRQQQREQGWVFVIFNITTWAGVLWVAIGLTGQLLFTGRMVVQWLASEKHRRSVVPPVFWWLSLLGASMLLAYFLWRKDIVGVIGQGSGWLIYARNLWMIHRPNFATPQPTTQ